MLTADDNSGPRGAGPSDPRAAADLPAENPPATAGPDRLTEDDALSELDGLVRTIGRRARRANLSRAAQLSTALRRAEADELDPAAREQAAQLAHQLVGSAGTFGFGTVSELAGQLEIFFGSGLFDGPGLHQARCQLAELSDRLQGDPTD